MMRCGGAADESRWVGQIWNDFGEKIAKYFWILECGIMESRILPRVGASFTGVRSEPW